ncbi:MAG: PQQ-binding-like beta-propeller repeat protein [Myxococcales bacterium]
MRLAVLALALVAACRGSAPTAGSLESTGSSRETDAGAAGDPAGAADQASDPPAAGALDGGADIAPVDGGKGSDGGADPGSRGVTCTPGGQAKLAWRITGHQSPWRADDNDWYAPLGTDGLDGVLVNHLFELGQSSSDNEMILDRDGGTRVSAVARRDCRAASPCGGTYAFARDGRVYSTDGTIVSAVDGHLIHRFERNAPGTNAGTFNDDGPIATNGEMTVYAAIDYSPDGSSRAFVSAVDRDGATLWQRTLGDAIHSLAVDGSNVTLALFSLGDLIAIDPGGRTLYVQPLNAGAGSGAKLQAAGGNFFLGRRTIYRVRDGAPSIVLQFDVYDFVLTASRLVLWRYEMGRRDAVIAIDPSSGTTIWERPALDRLRLPFSIAQDLTLVLDPTSVVHVVDADGQESIACQLPAGVWSPGVLLQGGRLLLERYPDLEAYDLP